MNLSGQQLKDLAEAAKPLMEWLKKNCHPHVTAIVDSETTEVTECLATIKRQ